MDRKGEQRKLLTSICILIVSVLILIMVGGVTYYYVGGTYFASNAKDVEPVTHQTREYVTFNENFTSSNEINEYSITTLEVNITWESGEGAFIANKPIHIYAKVKHMDLWVTKLMLEGGYLFFEIRFPKIPTEDEYRKEISLTSISLKPTEENRTLLGEGNITYTMPGRYGYVLSATFGNKTVERAISDAIEIAPQYWDIQLRSNKEAQNIAGKLNLLTIYMVSLMMVTIVAAVIMIFLNLWERRR